MGHLIWEYQCIKVIVFQEKCTQEINGHSVYLTIDRQMERDMFFSFKWGIKLQKFISNTYSKVTGGLFHRTEADMESEICRTRPSIRIPPNAISMSIPNSP